MACTVHSMLLNCCPKDKDSYCCWLPPPVFGCGTVQAVMSSSDVQHSSVLMFATVLPNNGGDVAAVGPEARVQEKDRSSGWKSVTWPRPATLPFHQGDVCALRSMSHVSYMSFFPLSNAPSTRLAADTSLHVALKEFFLPPAAAHPFR